MLKCIFNLILREFNATDRILTLLLLCELIVVMMMMISTTLKPIYNKKHNLNNFKRKARGTNKLVER